MKGREMSRNVEKRLEMSRNVKKRLEMSRNVQKCLETLINVEIDKRQEGSAKVVLDFGLELDKKLRQKLPNYHPE